MDCLAFLSCLPYKNLPTRKEVRLPEDRVIYGSHRSYGSYGSEGPFSPVASRAFSPVANHLADIETRVAEIERQVSARSAMSCVSGEDLQRRLEELVEEKAQQQEKQLVSEDEWQDGEVAREDACELEKENIEPCHSLEEGACNGADAIDVEPGDFVILGNGVPQEYHACQGIITKVAERHCTVVVLDRSSSQGIGECWPDFVDIDVKSRGLRIGRRVIINGMQGKKTKHLNGMTGTISRHPREGHPTFVKKNEMSGAARLTVCVAFENPGVKRALVEPRFLTAYDSAAERETQTLQEVFTVLVTPRATLVPREDTFLHCSPFETPVASREPSPRKQRLPIQL